MCRSDKSIYFDYDGHCAIRDTQFYPGKLHGKDWELYGMYVERMKLHNFIKGEKKGTSRMIGQYDNRSHKAGVMD